MLEGGEIIIVALGIKQRGVGSSSLKDPFFVCDFELN
jgi:hypothetical protein